MRNVKVIQHSIVIKAPVEHVWQRVFDPQAYRQWTAAFCEGSYYQGEWRQGETIRFLDPDGNGMVAHIAEVRPLEFMSISHQGFVYAGRDDLDSEQVTSWAPAFENFRFLRHGDTTELHIEQEVAAEYESFMQQAWPKALEKLKALCESSQAL